MQSKDYAGYEQGKLKNFESTLSPEEKTLYRKVLAEISKNTDFYVNSTPEEITSHLIDQCKLDKVAIYRLFKKINHFNNSTFKQD
ncbi:MAG: hypothetical protein ACOX7R_06540 [Acetivibrionales bacterium]|jgi:hypothetical protein